MNGRADLLDRHDRSCPKCHLTTQPNHERETLNKHLNIVKTNIYLNLSFLCEFAADLFRLCMDECVDVVTGRSVESCIMDLLRIYS